MLRQGNFTGNDRFEGFAIDLLHTVSKALKFDYEVYLVPDGNFGVKLPNGEWNGIIGEILSGVSIVLYCIVLYCIVL